MPEQKEPDDFESGDHPEPLSWQVLASRGRGQGPNDVGLPDTASVTFDTVEGPKTFHIDSPANATDSTTVVNAELVASVIVPDDLEACVPCCPICHRLRQDVEMTDEHVPPQSIGGVKAIQTCSDCNNKLGGWTEPALRDWYDQAGRVRIRLPGRRAPVVGRLSLRTSSDGSVLLILDQRRGGPDPFAQALAGVTGGTLKGTIEVDEPNRSEYQVAILKQAYLAAVLVLGAVPADSVASAREIRAELLAARDAGNRRSLPSLGPRAQAIRAFRTGTARRGPYLGLLKQRSDGDVSHMLSLTGTVLVDWPFPEINPRRWVGHQNWAQHFGTAVGAGGAGSHP